MTAATEPGSPSVADETRSLLLAIRLRAAAGSDVLAEVLRGLSLQVADVATLAGRLELAGLVEHRDGSFPGWRLTDDGRAEGERLLALELEQLGVRAAVTHAYDRFVQRNSDLLHVCTDWQLLDATPSAPVINDHTDADHDRRVIERLGEVHERVLPICVDLSACIDRFGAYGPRFTHAHERVVAGQVEAIDSPDTDSFHTIWFELHEHLLATVGRDRSTEPLPAPYRPPASS